MLCHGCTIHCGVPYSASYFGWPQAGISLAQKRKEPVTAEMLLAMVEAAGSSHFPYRGSLAGNLPCSICRFSKM